MRRKIFFLLVALFCVFALSMSLLGAKNIKLHRDYTLAIPISCDSFYTSDTVYYYLPVVDTFIDTNMYGEVDTLIEEAYPWPSVYDQNSYEVYVGDTATTIASYDRWAMEDWAFSFFITELNVAADVDSVSGHVQYQFPGAPGWTVLYTLFTDTDAATTLMTCYPLDLYDNWKLYRNARIRLIVTSDSVAVSSWLVGRQILQHRHVDPGE